MTLDLDDLLGGWACCAGEICARLIVGRDGAELLQLRVDLGVMQMWPDGRPDGQRYHGLPTVREYVEHELRVSGCLSPDDWQQLEREALQTNYRRLALSALADEAMQGNQQEAARRHLQRALRDTDGCLAALHLVRQNRGAGPLSLEPTLVFNHGRLKTQLLVLDSRYEEAVEAAETGASLLDELLASQGLEAENRQRDPGIQFLRNLARSLRSEYHVEQTLGERLAEAIEAEDFEAAARLREEMKRRRPSR